MVLAATLHVDEPGHQDGRDGKADGVTIQVGPERW